MQQFPIPVVACWCNRTKEAISLFIEQQTAHFYLSLLPYRFVFTLASACLSLSPIFMNIFRFEGPDVWFLATMS
jgi:hypothetical protein